MTRFRTLFVAALLSVCTYALAGGSMPQVDTGSWQPAGPLGEVRSGAASALLADGGVLVTGGAGEGGALASAELFGESGSFSLTAPMTAARADHTAVTLDDGRVLVVGGRNAEGAVGSAELYSAGSWTALENGLVDARWGHTATRLDDGRVLIAGGENALGIVSSLELFDPETGAFTPAGSLSGPRKGHAAARLPDGRVLVAGGFDGESVVAAIDEYDPETGTVAPLQDANGNPLALGTPRAGLSATALLDGRVLFFGGNDGSSDLPSGEIYNPAAGTIGASASAAVARRDHQAFLLPNNNAVLIVGGVTAEGASASAELYLPWKNQFLATGSLSGARASATGSPLSGESYGFSTVSDGRLVVAGGEGVSSADVYRFATIKTNVDDYAPGDQVFISGKGWQPGETVVLSLREVPGEHVPRVFEAVADSQNGTIPFTKLFDVEEHHLGVRFYLTAHGAASQAQTTFTDANNFDVTPLSQSVTAGSINTFNWTFVAQNAANQQTTTFTVPAGWTAPQSTNSSGAGYVTVAGSGTNPCNVSLQGISGMVITIRQSPPAPATGTCGNNTSFILTYANVTAPTPATPPQTYTFVNQHGQDPMVTVTAAANATPVITANNASVTVNEGQTATNTGTWSDANAGDTVTLTASVGTVVKSGTNASGTWSWSYPTTDGPDDSQTVTITANDGEGGIATTSFQLTVNNVAPTVNAGADATIDEGSTFVGTGSFTDPGTDTWTGTVDYGNGGGAVALTLNADKTFSLSHVYADDGVFTVTVTIDDGDGGIGSDTLTVTVNNVAPTVNAGADATIDEGSTFAGTGSFTDPGADTWTGTVDYGDGGGAVVLTLNADKTFSLSHVYADDGVYTVTVAVTDDDGGVGTDTLMVTVQNVAPTVDIGPDATADEGSPFTRNGSFTDPGTVDTHTATVDYGDGDGSQPLTLNPDKTFSLSHVYADDGVFTVTVTITDDDGGVGIDTLMVTVQNVAPSVDAGADATINEGSTFSSAGSFTDPGTDTWTATVNYGDGSGNQTLALAADKTFVLSHHYDDNGVFTVTVTVTDDDGGVGSDTVFVTVNNVPPVATFAATSPIDEGGSSTLSLTGPIDPSAADTAAGFKYSFACSPSDPLATTYAGAGTSNTGSCTFADNGTYTVRGRIFDKDNGYTTYEASVVVNNVPPSLDTLTPSAFTVPLGTLVTVTGEYSDPGTLDTHTCYVNWDDGGNSTAPGIKDSGDPSQGTCSASRTFATQGVYTISMYVKDDDGGTSNTLTVMVTVFDPSGGFVTGGGWINSPPGASTLFPEAVGKANFGFVSKYKKGSHVPEGQTEFQFKAGDLNFHSSSYESGSLVVSGHKAQYKGVGTVNGLPGFKFVLTAYDGQAPGGGGYDRFRMKIVRMADNYVIYDNAMGSSDDIDGANPIAIGGGSIVIHDNKGK